MTRIVAAFLILIAPGCARQTPDAEPPAEPARAEAAQQTPDAADTACDSLIAVGGRVLHIDVRRTGDREVENPFVGAEHRLRPGCRVTGADPTDRTAAPVDDIYGALERAGWKPLLRYGADGPDGSVVGFLRDRTICVITGRWDGGDDADSTYVPEPGYEIEAVCFGAIPVDTADGGM